MQAVEQKHPCVRGCTPPLSLSLSLSLSSLSLSLSSLSLSLTFYLSPLSSLTHSSLSLSLSLSSLSLSLSLSHSLSLSESPLSSLSPPISQLTTTTPSSSISPLSLSFYLFVLLLKLSYSLSPASGLHFQSAQNTPVFVWSVSFIFLTLDGLQGRGGQERMGKRRRRRRRHLTGVAGQIPLLWGALGIRDMVRPLEPSWFIGCHGLWQRTDALGLNLAMTSFTEHVTFPALKASSAKNIQRSPVF